MAYVNINGNRVKSLRQATNLTQTELAELLPITKQAISKIENKGEDAQIREENLKSLAEALRCTAEYLRGETNIFNEFRNEDGIWLKQPFFKDTSFKKTNTDYDSLTLESQLLVSEIFDTIKNLSTDRLTVINDLCKIIAKTPSIKD